MDDVTLLLGLGLSFFLIAASTFLLMLPYTILLWLDKKAGVDGKAKEPKGTSRLRLLRLISGSLTLLAGLVTLFVLGMIYRPLASSGLAGVFIVGSFFAGALADSLGYPQTVAAISLVVVFSCGLSVPTGGREFAADENPSAKAL